MLHNIIYILCDMQGWYYSVYYQYYVFAFAVCFLKPPLLRT